MLRNHQLTTCCNQLVGHCLHASVELPLRRLCLHLIFQLQLPPPSFLTSRLLLLRRLLAA